MRSISRRGFISALGAGTAGLSLTSFAALHARSALGAPSFGRGFGPLSAKLPLNTAALNNPFIGDLRNLPILALPEGFEYWVISPTGDPLSNGTDLVPGDHDGMAAFIGPRATTILVRNHELSPSETSKPQVNAPKYDPVCRGGTTTLILDNQGQLISHFASLAGTFNNCAGGLTPWGTWVTCEENSSMPPASGVTVPHGFLFEVNAYSTTPSAPTPVTAAGRFNHEAIAVDPATGAVYETEDRGDSCFYRYTPNQYGQLHAGGDLHALKLVDHPTGVNTGSGFLPLLNQPLAVQWVKIDVPNPLTDTVRAEAQSKGAARFVRGEGAWYGNGLIYFVSTGGGNAGAGQVFAYDPAASTLTLIWESVPQASLGYTDPSFMGDDLGGGNGGFVLAAPDNVTVGPDGRIYLCEDGNGVEKVVGLNSDGEMFEAARNLLNSSEFAGSCFSHDGRFMFVNIQSPGLTCVVRGNWRQGQR
jgi:uncharacterized protein